jgi:hypothetical protein
MNTSHLKLTFLAVCLLALGIWPLFAQEADAVPQITIENSADGLTTPAEMPEGVVGISFVNSMEVSMAPLIVRLNDGVTVEAFGEALSAGGPVAVLDLVALLGGTQVMPAATVAVAYDFVPGTYVLLDVNSEAPAPQTFTVADAEGDGAAAPEADVNVTLLDFAFSLPTTITAGEHTWQVENKGAQWHEMGIGRIDADTTIGEFHEALKNAAAGEESAGPIEEVFTWLPTNQGERAWFTLDLEAGTYVVICFLPDFVSGHPHFNLGMVQFVTVE